MAQTVLFVIFVVEFALALVVLLTWKSDYGLSSFEERHPPPPPPTTGRCRMLQLARHRRTKRRRQRKRCRQESHRHEGYSALDRREPYSPNVVEEVLSEVASHLCT
jgi:hypothetical protein